MNENEYGRRDEEYRDKISSLAAEIDKMQPNMLAEQNHSLMIRMKGINHHE